MPMGNPLHQFPQPTRPPFSYYVDSNPLLPEEGFTQEFHHPEMLELPKPTRPVDLSGYDTCSESNPPRDDRSRSCDPSSEPCASASEEERIRFSPETGKTPKGEKEAVDELLLILLECMEELNTKNRESLLRKFFSEIEKEERLERFIVERLKQSRVKAISEMCEKLPASVRGQMDSDGASGFPSIGESEAGSISTRSIHESVEELAQKLERFKVRPFDLTGGVIKKDEKK